MTQPGSLSRPITGPLLLAIVFLVIIGGSAGVVLGLRSADSSGSQAGPGPGANGNVGNGTTNISDPPRGGNGQGGTGQQPQPDRPECLAHTERLARAGDLSLVLYLRTGHSEVWICRDTGGRLFYQGYIGPRGQRQLTEGVNSLFLSDVRVVEQGYLATNTTAGGVTTYLVNRDWLRIDNAGDVSQEPAVGYYQP